MLDICQQSRAQADISPGQAQPALFFLLIAGVVSVTAIYIYYNIIYTYLTEAINVGRKIQCVKSSFLEHLWM